MRGRLLGVLLLALALPSLPAKPVVEPVVSYLDASGHFRLGLQAGEIRDLGADLGTVNSRRFQISTDDCYRDVRFGLDYSPRNTTLSAGRAHVTVANQFELRLSDTDTGLPLPNGTLTWNVPGTRAYLMETPQNLTLDLTLRHGLEVDYTFNVAGWRALEAECSWQGLVFINEVEANPAGIDAGNEWVEIWNNGLMTVDLGGWNLTAHHNVPQSLVLPAGTLVAPGSYLVVTFTQGQFLDNDSETVTLTAPNGWEVDVTPAASDFSNDGNTWQRVPDGSDSWSLAAGTPGTQN